MSRPSSRKFPRPLFRQGQANRRDLRTRTRRAVLLGLEPLEGRIVLSGGTLPGSGSAQFGPLGSPAIGSPTITIQGGPLALGVTEVGDPGVPQSYTVGGTDLTADIIVTPPTGVELSTDGTTWQPSLTLPQTSGAVASTTVYARLSATASAGLVTGNIANTSTDATTANVAVTGVVVNDLPAITATPGSVSLGMTNVGTPGTAASFTVSGEDLAGNLVVVAPAGVEISGDGGSTWTTGLSFTPTAGVVTSKSLQARLNGYTAGVYNAPIVVRSLGAAPQNVAATGTINTVSPTMSVNPASSFSVGQTTYGTAGVAATFYVAGSGLTANLVVTAPSGVELSGDDGTTWQAAITLTPSSKTVASTTLKARIKADTAVGNVSGNIVLSTTGASNINLATTGKVIAAPAIALSTSSLTLWTATSGAPSSPAYYTITPTNLADNITVSTQSSDVEISLDSTNWSSSLTVYRNAAGTLTRVYARIKSGVAVGAVSGSIVHESSGATTQTLAFGGEVIAPVTPAPSMSVSANSIGLGIVNVNSTGNYVQLTVDGANLTGDITVTAPAGIGITTNQSNQPSSSITFTPVGGIVGTKQFWVRINSSAVGGTISGNLTFTSPGATSLTVALTGSIAATNTPTVTVDISSLDLGTTNSGTAGASAPIFVQGKNLTGNIVVTAPAGFEVYSTATATWGSSATITQSGGFVGLTGLPARIASTASAGAVSGTFTVSSTGATTLNVAATGSVNAAGTPLILSSLSVYVASVTAGSSTPGTTSIYTVSGENLTAPIVITAPSQIELSKDGGTTWAASLSLTPSSGTVATTVISLRIKAVASYGIINAGITHTSGAATSSTAVNAVVSMSYPTITSFSPTLASPAGGSVLTLIGKSFLGVTSVKVGSTSVSFEILSDNQIAFTAPAGTAGESGTVTLKNANNGEGSTTFTYGLWPALSTNVTYLELGTGSTGYQGPVFTFVVSGTNLGAAVGITAPSGVFLSLTGSVYYNQVTLSPVNGTLAGTTVYIRLGTGPVGAISGYLAINATNLNVNQVAVSGNIITSTSPTSPSVSPSSLDLGSTTEGTAGTQQSFSVSASGLTNNLMISAPEGVELTDDGGTTWFTTRSYVPSSGSVSKSLKARISKTAEPGSVTGDILVYGVNVFTKTISVTGTVNTISPAVVTSPALLDLGAAVEGTSGQPQTFTVFGSGLTNNLVVTAPDGVEISDDDGTTWASSKTYTPTSGTVATKTMKARIKSTASTGVVSGSISAVSTGATSRDVYVVGKVVPAPAVTVSPSSLSLGTVYQGTAGTNQTFTVSGTDLIADLVVTAPTGVEVSTDGTTWSASVTLPEDGGSVASTTVYARIKSTASVGAISANIGVATTLGTTKDVAVTGTVLNVPLVTVSPASLDLGSTYEGTAGTSYSYTISGSYLVADITVTAPTGVEVSKDGTTWSSSLTFTKSEEGSVSASTVYARITSTASVGAISANIANATTDGTTKNVAVTGTVLTAPLVTVSPASLDLGSTYTGTAGTSYSYTISGSNLIANIVATAPTGVEVSTDGTTWSASVTLTKSEEGNVASTTVYARIKSTAAVGAISANIANTTTSGVTKNVAVTGTVLNIPLVTVSPASLDLGSTYTGTAGTSYSYTISGTYLVADITVTAPTGVEVSKDGTTWSSSLTFAKDGSGNVDSTTVYARITSAASVGAVSANIANATTDGTTKNVAVTGTVLNIPLVTVSPASLDLGSTYEGTAGTSYSYTISGTYLVADITVTAPTGVEVSKDGTTWSSSLTFAKGEEGSVSASTVYARITSAASVGAISANIANATTDGTTKNVAVTGTVLNVPLVTVSPASLDLGSTYTGTAGTSYSYTISGTYLVADITVTAPTGVEVSKDGTTWSSSLTFTKSEQGSVSASTVYARITSTASLGAVSANIANATTDGTTKNVAVTGTVLNIPLVTVSPASLDLGSTYTGTAGTSYSYTISGTYLVADITVTAPTGVEVSKDGTTWSSSLTFAKDGSGNVDSSTVYARITSTASLGAVSANIANATTDGTTEDVAVTGTVLNVPLVTVSPASLDLGSTYTGTAGTSYSYTISGTYLVADITVTAPTGVEVSKDGTTWSSSLTFTKSEQGSVSASTVYARITSAASVGAVSANIANATTDGTTEDVAVTGTVLNIPLVTVSPASLDLGSTYTGTAGTSYSYTISGTYLVADITVTAPTGVEVSKDGTTWSSSLTFAKDGSGNVDSTTVYARITSTASLGAVSANIANATTDGTTEDVAVTGTVLNIPLVTVSPASLDLGSTYTGTAGTSYSYTISGTYLVADITVTAPTGVEVSKDGTTWSSSLTCAKDGSGNVDSTTVYARITSTASLGAVSANIANATTDGTTEDVAVTGTVLNIPLVTVSPASLDLGSTYTGTAGTSYSYTISGTYLVADITVTAPTGVEVSKDGTTWSSSLTFAKDGSGNVDSATVYARITSGAALGPISANIANATTDGTTEDVAVTGTVLNIPLVTVSPASLDLGITYEGKAGASYSYTISGTYLVADITVTAPTGVEVSKDGTTWSSSLTFAKDGSGNVDSTTVYARITSAAPVGAVSANIANATTDGTTEDVAVTGTVNEAPAVSASPGSLSLGTIVEGTAGPAQTFAVTGSNLVNVVVVTPPGGVEVSDDDGSTWHDSLNIAPVAGAVSKTLKARIKSTASVGAVTGNIAVTSTGAANQNVAVTGMVNAVGTPTVTVSTATLDLGKTAQGSPGTSYTYTISGSSLSANIVITAPTGVEVSLDGTTWSSTRSISPTSGSVATTTVYVRISSTAAVGGLAGTIANASTGAATENVAVSGIVQNAITLSPETLTAAQVGTPYSQQFVSTGGSGSGYTYHATGLPPGLNLSESGLLSGTPTSAAGSPFTLEITVTDGDGTSATFSYELVVERAQSEAGNITTSSPQVYYGETVVLTATFSATAAGSNPMTGTVSFYEGSIFLGTAAIIPAPGASAALVAGAPAPTLVHGYASLPDASLAVGNHIITAIYSGDANYAEVSTETPVAVQVVAATTSTQLAVNTGPQGTTLVATVTVTSPGNPTLTGNVTFYDGTTVLGTAPLVNGVATLSIGVMPAGLQAFTAVFTGDGTASSSAAQAGAISGGPQVVGLTRYGFHARPTALVLQFNQRLDPSRAQDVANYIITDSRGRRIALKSARYDEASMTVTLLPATRLDLHRSYRLEVVGSGATGLTSAAGVLLNGSGASGTNFVAPITWKALAVRGSSPAITFLNGRQTSADRTSFNRYVYAVVRATRAASGSAGRLVGAARSRIVKGYGTRSDSGHRGPH